MRTTLIGAAALAVALVASSARAQGEVRGEYVESRSANIYAGACHHEGEVTTMGRNAVLAWNVREGDFQGVSLAGVRVLAVVNADRNFELAGVQRRSVIYVDSQATAEQQRAIVAFLRARCGEALGKVLKVKTAPIRFDSAKSRFEVTAKGVAHMSIAKKTGNICCLQPMQYWGKAFIGLKQAKAGFSFETSYKDNSLIAAWAASKMNNAYYGDFSL